MIAIVEGMIVFATVIFWIEFGDRVRTIIKLRRQIRQLTRDLSKAGAEKRLAEQAAAMVPKWQHDMKTGKRNW
jgi:hypothetical protein